MLRDDLRTLWTEPRPPDTPARVRRDWVLLAAGLGAVVAEATLREDVVWRPVAVLFAVTRFRFAVSATLVAAALALQGAEPSFEPKFVDVDPFQAALLFSADTELTNLICPA